MLISDQKVLKSACYIWQVVNPRATAISSTGRWFFFSRTMHIHIRLLRHNALFVVYNNCPGQQDPQISRQLNMYGTWWSRNLLFLQSLPQPLPNCDNGCKILGTIYWLMTFGSYITICMWQYMPALPPEGATLCIDATILAPLTVTCVFHLVWICYHRLLCGNLAPHTMWQRHHRHTHFLHWSTNCSAYHHSEQHLSDHPPTGRVLPPPALQFALAGSSS